MTSHSQNDPKEESPESAADLSEQESMLAGDFDGLLGAHGPEPSNSKTADSTEDGFWSAGRMVSAILIIAGGFLPWIYTPLGHFYGYEGEGL